MSALGTWLPWALCWEDLRPCPGSMEEHSCHVWCCLPIGKVCLCSLSGSGMPRAIRQLLIKKSLCKRKKWHWNDKSSIMSSPTYLLYLSPLHFVQSFIIITYHGLRLELYKSASSTRQWALWRKVEWCFVQVVLGPIRALGMALIKVCTTELKDRSQWEHLKSENSIIFNISKHFVLYVVFSDKWKPFTLFKALNKKNWHHLFIFVSSHPSSSICHCSWHVTGAQQILIDQRFWNKASLILD